MITREHGTWAMLLVPLIVGLSLGEHWSWALPLFALASLAFFLARYPLSLVFRSYLGRRAQTGRERLWLALYSALALALGLTLLIFWRLWWLLALGALSLVFLALSLYLVKERLERTERGESLGVAALALSAPAAYYVATGTLGVNAFLLWALSYLYFEASVFYVKMKVVHRGLRDRSSASRWRVGRATAIYHGAAVAVLLVLALTGLMPWPVLLAFVPLLGKAAWAIVTAPPMTIRQVGFTELGLSLLFGGLLFVALQGAF